MILRYYTYADLPILQQYLADAYAARAALATGGKVATVSMEGKSVSYNAANADLLAGWIRDLTETVNYLTGVSTRRGPLYAAF